MITEKDVLFAVSRNIKKYRKMEGLSQERLAEKADVSWNTISLIECSVRFLSSKTLVKIANALDIEPHQLFVIERNARD